VCRCRKTSKPSALRRDLAHSAHVAFRARLLYRWHAAFDTEYGSKSRRGTVAAATLYSLIETAKLHGVNPARYLREAVLASRRGEVLLPWQLPN